MVTRRVWRSSHCQGMQKRRATRGIGDHRSACADRHESNDEVDQEPLEADFGEALSLVTIQPKLGCKMAPNSGAV